jgi:hypothetical protein
MRRWLSDRYNGLVDGIVSAAVLSGGLWAYSRHLVGLVWLVPISIIGATAAFYVLRVGRRRAGAARSIKTLSNPTDYERLALSHSMNARQNFVDDTHFFTSVQQTYRVAGNDGFFKLRYKGVNASRSPSYCFVDMIAGDSPMDLDDMNISVVDVADGRPLSWIVVSDDPYCKTIEMRFQQPVQPGSHFEIEWSCEWKGTFTRKKDYVFCNHYPRRRGIEFVGLQVVLPAQPAFIEGVRYDGRTIAMAAIQPFGQIEDGLWYGAWEIEKFRGNQKHVYVIQFERTDM